MYSKQNFSVINVKKINLLIFGLFNIPIQVRFKFTSLKKKKENMSSSLMACILDDFMCLVLSVIFWGSYVP